jgi:hypothetical protein
MFTMQDEKSTPALISMSGPKADSMIVKMRRGEAGLLSMCQEECGMPRLQTEGFGLVHQA